jgi:hypothetical protein
MKGASGQIPSVDRSVVTKMKMGVYQRGAEAFWIG